MEDFSHNCCWLNNAHIFRVLTSMSCRISRRQRTDSDATNVLLQFLSWSRGYVTIRDRDQGTTSWWTVVAWSRISIPDFCWADLVFSSIPLAEARICSWFPRLALTAFNKILELAKSVAFLSNLKSTKHLILSARKLKGSSSCVDHRIIHC
jgi:hypothetical protein